MSAQYITKQLIYNTMCVCFGVVRGEMDGGRSGPSVRQIASKYAPFGALFYFVCHSVDHFLPGRATAF
jgi:hypothetical protein